MFGVATVVVESLVMCAFKWTSNGVPVRCEFRVLWLGDPELYGI